MNYENDKISKLNLKVELLQEEMIEVNKSNNFLIKSLASSLKDFIDLSKFGLIQSQVHSQIQSNVTTPQANKFKRDRESKSCDKDNKKIIEVGLQDV